MRDGGPLQIARRPVTRAYARRIRNSRDGSTGIDERAVLTERVRRALASGHVAHLAPRLGIPEDDPLPSPLRGRAPGGPGDGADDLRSVRGEARVDALALLELLVPPWRAVV